MSEGLLKRRIRQLDPILNLKGTEHCWASLPDLDNILDEAKKEFPYFPKGLVKGLTDIEVYRAYIQQVWDWKKKWFGDSE